MNESHLKRGPFQREHSLPTSIFRGYLLVFGGALPIFGISPGRTSHRHHPAKKECQSCLIAAGPKLFSLGLFVVPWPKKLQKLAKPKAVAMVAMLSKCTFWPGWWKHLKKTRLVRWMLEWLIVHFSSHGWHRLVFLILWTTFMFFKQTDASQAASKHLYTPPKTSMSPKKALFQEEIHLPTIDFEGTC